MLLLLSRVSDDGTSISVGDPGGTVTDFNNFIFLS